jgi:hypothetical protein
MDVTRSEFTKIAQEGRNMRLLLLFGTFCHVVYATLGVDLAPRGEPVHFLACTNVAKDRFYNSQPFAVSTSSLPKSSLAPYGFGHMTASVANPYCLSAIFPHFVKCVGATPKLSIIKN